MYRAFLYTDYVDIFMAEKIGGSADRTNEMFKKTRNLYIPHHALLRGLDGDRSGVECASGLEVIFPGDVP